MVDSNAKSTAEKIAAELIWRLEVLQHRGRYNVKTGEYRQLPTRIRRFANACPTDIVADVIDALIKMAPYTRVVFNGEDDPSLKYRPTMTSIRKDDSLKSTEGSKGTYTIIQDLLLEDEFGDVYAAGDSSSCSQVVTSTYYWDEADIAECPQGGQGVSYQVVGVSRDHETDLFSFQVRKVQAVTQHLPERVVECDDERSKTQEVWDNVYTDDTGETRVYKMDDVVHGGEAIEIPDPCDDAETGQRISVSVSENPDCTLKIAIERVTAKFDVWSEYSRYKDQFNHRSMDLWNNVLPVEGDKDGIDYDRNEGTKTTVEVKDNGDGTVNRRVTVEKDLTVYEVEKSTTRTPRYTEVSWTDKSQMDPATALPQGYKYGTWKSVKTAVGRYDNTYTGYELVTDALGYQCNDTAFLHTHSNTESSTVYPDPETCVPVAKGGIVTTYDIAKDERGVVTKTTRTQTEHEYESFRRTVQSTLLGRVVRIYSKSMSKPLDEPQEGSIGMAEYAVTDGRLYDTVSETFVLNQANIELGAACRRTVFEHEDSKEVTTPEMGEHVTEAGNGFFRTTRYAKDVNTGAIRRTADMTEELQFYSAEVVKRVTPKHTMLQVTNRNTRLKASDLKTDELEVGHAETRKTNPGGSVDQVLTNVVVNKGAELAAQCDLTVLQHSHQKETVLDDDAKVEAGKTLEAGEGYSRTEVVSVDDDNVKTSRVRETYEFNHEYGSRVDEDALAARQVIEETSSEKNVGDVDGKGETFSSVDQSSDKGEATALADAPSSIFDVNTQGKGRIASSSSARAGLAECITTGRLVTGGDFKRGIQYTAESAVTDGGHFHTKRHKDVPKPQKWLDAALIDEGGGHYTWQFRNLTEDQVKDLVKDSLRVADGASNETGGFYSSFKAHPFVRRSLNEYGLYDGQCGFEASTQTFGSDSGWGKKRKIEEVAAEVIAEWTEVSCTIKPVSQLDPNAPDYAVGGNSFFYVQVTRATYHHVVGVGKNMLHNYCAAGAFWASPSIQISPDSESFSVVACVKQTTDIHMVKGAVLSESPQDDTLVEGYTVNL